MIETFSSPASLAKAQREVAECQRFRGAHLQGNDMMRPIFQVWLDPFKDS